VGPAEAAADLLLPVHVYPLFESVVAARAGHDAMAHRQAMGRLFAPFTEVAAGHPYAWFPTARSADEIATPSPENRIVAEPYTKRMTAFLGSDQGAAVIVCSLAAARRAGVADRAVFVWAGAEATDVRFPTSRPDPGRSPAIAAAGRALFEAAGVGVDDLERLDLYSCFPSAVEIGAAELGLPLDDPDRPLTVTGGMTFAGGPGNNYGTHAIATMVGALRADPGTTGLVTGLGWYLSTHSIGLYGTAPGGAVDPGDRALPERTEVQGAGGFWWADPQIAVGALPQTSSDADAEGEVTVETYAVAHHRGGAPERAVVACRTPGGLRAWATVTDPDQLDVLIAEEGCGRPGTLSAGGQVDLH
jgi:acetyl-CoA C-acetyltransferase